MSCADPLVERIAREQRAARARADRLRSLLPVAAAKLRARGASRVLLFGSLATGAEPHAASDVDLAVAGLDADAIAESTMELEALTGARVDIVALERAPDRLLTRIARDGKDV
jgi:predicted nucleotidyltransferase